MLIVACGILGIALLFIRLLDYGSARSASTEYLKRNPKAIVVGSYRVRSIIFFSLALLMIMTLIFFSKGSTAENSAVIVLLSMIMLSEVINSLSYYRAYVGEKDILVKDKVIQYKRIKSVTKKGYLGTFKITLFNNETLLAPNACFKPLLEKNKIKITPK